MKGIEWTVVRTPPALLSPDVHEASGVRPHFRRVDGRFFPPVHKACTMPFDTGGLCGVFRRAGDAVRRARTDEG